MKIIKRGEAKSKVCPTCGCYFEYEIADIEHINGMTCMNKGTDVVYCPQCKERIHEKYGCAVNSLGHYK